MESLEISAKTEEEAVEIALEKLDAAREEVEVVVLKKGKTGFLGLGGEEATVRVSRLQPAEEQEEQEAVPEEEGVAVAKSILEDLLAVMKLSATVTEKRPLPPEGEGPVVLDITGDDLGILIGRRGQTLLSLQHLVYLMASHRLKGRVPVTVDVEGYRQRRREALVGLAHRLAQSVQSSGKQVELEPMPANERRIVHLALQDYEGVTTESVGEGDDRKVVIKQT